MPYGLSPIDQIEKVTKYERSKLKNILDGLCSKGLVIDIWIQGDTVYYKVMNFGGVDSEGGISRLYVMDLEKATDYLEPVPAGQTVIGRFGKLRCMDFDPDKNRWTWLYTRESKTLKFDKSYSSIPRKLRPIVLGSFFLRNGNELLLDLRSFERAIKAIPFFDKHLGQAIARITHAAVVNRFFDAQEQFFPNLDTFFNSGKMIEIDPDKAVAEIESLIETNYIDGNPDWPYVFEQRAKKTQPEVEKFPLYFYEEGITSLKTTLRMRHIMAFEHWKGNVDYTLFDVIKTMISKYRRLRQKYLPAKNIITYCKFR